MSGLLLNACSTSTGTGMPPLSPPNGQQPQQNGMVPNNAPQSRQQVAEDVATLDKGEHSVDVAKLAGFDFTIDLTKPSPAPAASARPSGKPRPTPKPTPTPSPSASPTPSPTPASWKGKPTPTPTPSGPRIDAKITIYPDGTQKPPGDGESEQARRVPVVKVVLDPSVDVALYSLGAFEFTIPKGEDEEDRGFTVALYETRKYHKDRFIDSQMDAKSSDGIVRATNAKDTHMLSKGHTYTVILFGDPLPQTPSPYSPPQYPGAQMQYQQPPQQPVQPGFGQQPFPQQPGFITPTPYPTPTRPLL